MGRLVFCLTENVVFPYDLPPESNLLVSSLTDYGDILMTSRSSALPTL
jgi:hypothetical protein